MWLCVVILLLNRVQIFATPLTVAHKVSLSFTISQSLLKLMCIESVMLSKHLILCHPLLLLPSAFPSIRVFSSESVLCIRWPKCGASASAVVLLMDIQDFPLGFPLGLTGLISLCSARSPSPRSGQKTLRNNATCNRGIYY